MGQDDFLDQGLASMEGRRWRPPPKPSAEGEKAWKNEYPEPDDYVMVIADLIDIGIQPSPYPPFAKHQVCVIFELDEPMKSDGYPHIIHQKMTRSLFEKAPLYRLICAAFPGESHAGIKLGDLIGKSVYGTVELTPRKNKPGEFWVDASGFKKLPRKESPLVVRGDYSEPTALASWMMRNAITEQEANQRNATMVDPRDHKSHDAPIEDNEVPQPEGEPFIDPETGEPKF